MITDIGEITDTCISWLLDDPSRPTITITSEYPEELRVIYFFAECCVSFLFSESDDISTLIEIISRDYDELSGDMSLECEDRSTSSRLLSLFDIVYFFPLIHSTKIFLEAF